MRNIKKILFIILFISINSLTFSQINEIGGFGGLSYYIGDLNPRKHFYKSKPAVGLIYKRNLKHDRYVIRSGMIYSALEAWDKDSKSKSNVNRNLNFKTDILELSLLLEVNFLKYRIGKPYNRFSPYLFFGVAGYKFNPKGVYLGESFELQPLGTEGQNTSQNKENYYKLIQLSIPIGFGAKININQRMTLAWEYGLRKTFTDYIDDVSKKYVNNELLEKESGRLTSIFADRSLQKGFNSNTGSNRGDDNFLKDWYFFTGFTIYFKIERQDRCYDFKMG